jgi:hypothetical protein
MPYQTVGSCLWDKPERVTLAEQVRRWIKEDVPAGRTAKVHLAIARRQDVSIEANRKNRKLSHYPP